MSEVQRGAACGVLLPGLDPVRAGGARQVTEAARLAEQLGFGAAWTFDDLACPPGLDAPAALAAAGAVTARIGLGLGAMALGRRAPAWTAKQLTAIDALAGPGRLRVGVGVGLGAELPGELEPAGMAVERRGARVDDALAVLPDLLCGRPVDHAGATLTVRSPALAPAPAALPPVYVGGDGEPALRRAARFGDVWLATMLTPARVAEQAAMLAEMATEHSRPPPRTALLVLIRIDDDRAAARAQADAHLSIRYRMDLGAVERWTVLDSIDGAVDQLSAYTAIGVSEVLLLTLGAQPLTQYERVAEVSARLRADPIASAATGRAR